MKRLVFLSLAVVFLTTGCKNLMTSSGLPQQYEPELAEYDEPDEPQTFLGTLKSKVTGTADTLKSGVDKAADSITESAQGFRDATLSEFGDHTEPEFDE